MSVVITCKNGLNFIGCNLGPIIDIASIFS